jgi:hypothetical protein
LESIPEKVSDWQIKGMAPGRAANLSASLEAHRDEAYLFRKLAILRTDVPLSEKLSDLEWRGALPQLKKLCEELGDESIPERVAKWQ